MVAIIFSIINISIFWNAPRFVCVLLDDKMLKISLLSFTRWSDFNYSFMWIFSHFPPYIIFVYCCFSRCCRVPACAIILGPFWWRMILNFIQFNNASSVHLFVSAFFDEHFFNYKIQWKCWENGHRFNWMLNFVFYWWINK